MEISNKKINTPHFGTKMFFDKASKKIYKEALSSNPAIMMPVIKIFQKQAPNSRIILRKTGEFCIPTRINPNGYKVHKISAENLQNGETETFNIWDITATKQLNFIGMFKKLMKSETFWARK